LRWTIHIGLWPSAVIMVWRSLKIGRHFSKKSH